jgi:hypothetical protein
MMQEWCSGLLSPLLISVMFTIIYTFRGSGDTSIIEAREEKMINTIVVLKEF